MDMAIAMDTDMVMVMDMEDTVDTIMENDLLRLKLDMAMDMVMDLVLMDMDMDTDMDMVMDMVTGMDMAMVMATVDIIMERDLLKLLRHQWFMLYLKDLPMLDKAMDMATDMAMVMVTDMAMDMMDIVTVMVTMVVRMVMDIMEVIISPAFISYYYILYVVT